ncbi:L-serine ammonia-lyase [Fastidiosibacter lacustris]|uniref:L-serine ammonia-lyase n=1 Tax=Fastidiosibacter lacustris TaxID=2056695 RepID=UPI000E346AD7|nr:L-serine ammonia-lyase [Fastidiosibacter lacustris]
MNISIFDLFSIGVGPSSSHTVGPMRATFRFLQKNHLYLEKTTRFCIELFGSLALTGKGHKTDYACVLGAAGFEPHTIDIDKAALHYFEILKNKRIKLLDEKEINFDYEKDFVFHYDQALPEHANGMLFTLFDDKGKVLVTRKYFSVGGGFILDENEMQAQSDPAPVDAHRVPYPFSTAHQLLELCHKHHMNIAELMMANECSLRPKVEVEEGILKIWQVMDQSIDKGLATDGELPGGLAVKRRAYKLKKRLESGRLDIQDLNWLNVFAIAVNEENAAGGKVVTAPTNGAAGIIPAVLKHHILSYPFTTKKDIIDYLLTTAAVGILFKKGASISAAEVGCQGEVGVACSMAAAGLCALLGGTVLQVENAAEMGMEHNLGLTCDPIGGLVQIPCIERNAMGAVQAVNAAKLSLLGDGEHHVSLDKVIQTMKETGKDMSTKYKETSLGGLAVNLPAC